MAFKKNNIYIYIAIMKGLLHHHPHSSKGII